MTSLSTTGFSLDQSSVAIADGLYGRRVPPSRDGMAPTKEQLASLIAAAASVPDHGPVRPWRFVAITGEARDRLGEAMSVDAFEATGHQARADKARKKAHAAPCLVMLVASVNSDSPIPAWEQLASAACTGYAIVLAAQGLGLGAVWKSTSLRDGKQLRAFCDCDANEELLGWVLVGSREDGGRRKSSSVSDSGELLTIIE